MSDLSTTSEPQTSNETVTTTAPRKNLLRTIRHNPLMMGGIIVLLIAAAIGGFLYWQDLQRKIYIEKSEISGPIISLSSGTMGILDELYVKEGDHVVRGQHLAKVSGDIILAKTSGVIIWVQNTPGQIVSPQTVVLKMIDPSTMRIVGHLEEDKGLSEVRPGQKVVFTVDAFGNKTYTGTVERIGVTSRDTSIVFSISDKRAQKEFDVTVTYDINAYPELRNGMSAKMWIYK
jgi:multidrug resistance efflux pump